MKILILVFAFSVPLFVNAQCLDGFRKLLPDKNATPQLNLSKLASGGSWFVTSSAAFDSTGFFAAGAAFVYKLSGQSWTAQALLTPSNARQQLNFGNQITMDSTGETIIVSSSPGNFNLRKNEIYVFRRPGAEWTAMNETERLSPPDTTGTVQTLMLSKDGLTLAVGLKFAINEGLWIYERPSTSANFGDTPPVKIPSPAYTDFFGSAVAITSHTIVVIAEAYRVPNQNVLASPVFVFRRSKTAGYPKLAEMKNSLTGSVPNVGVKATDNLITFPARVTTNALYTYALLTFQKDNDQQWADTTNYIAVPFLAASELLIDPPGFSLINDSTFTVSYGYSILAPAYYVPEFGIVAEIRRQGKRWSRSQRIEIFNEPSITDFRFIGRYGAQNIWTGSELLISPTPVATGSKFPNAITSFRETGSGWSAPSKVLGPGNKSTGFNFGSSIVHEGNNLLIGSQHDSEKGMNAGAVVVYSKNGPGDWVNTGKIIPPDDVFIHDNGFGNVIAASDSMLAVAGSSYNYPSAQSANGQILGKVFIYKRTGNDWSSAKLVQEIKPGGSFYQFGNTISISGSLLVIGGQDFGTSNVGNRNSLMIYKRHKGLYIFSQEISFGNPFEGASSGATVIRNDTIFNFSAGGIISPVTCNILVHDASGVYSPIADFVLPNLRTSEQLNSLTKLSIATDQDHVFIGMPSAEVESVPYAGAIVVFTKPAGTKWPAGAIHYSSLIFPKDKIKGQSFGYSVSVAENVLMVGAPGNNLLNENPILVTPLSAGAVYTFRTSDHEWVTWEQLGKFQGTKVNDRAQDLMGYTVLADTSDFFSSAPFESNGAGARAGVVYTLAPPTMIHPVSLICKGTSPLKLFGYPAGGVWAGTNVNPTSGLFNATPLDTGRYIVTYTSPACSVPAKMVIHITDLPQGSLLTASTITICSGSSTVIKLNKVAGIAYQWYFKKVGVATYSVLAGETSSTVTASAAGEYYSDINNGICNNSSPVTQVIFEPKPPYIGNQDVVCNVQKSVTLRANPSGGTWSGDHVQAGVFNPAGLVPAQYPINYNFISALGCSFSYNDSVRVATMPAVQLAEVSTDYCITGSFSFTTIPQQGDWTYSWRFRKTLTQNSAVIDAVSLPERVLPGTGFYKVQVSNTYCSTTTNELNEIADGLTITRAPANPTISVCKETSLELSASGRDNVEYEWSGGATPQGPFAEVGNGETITISSGGYYYVTAKLGFCKTVSDVQHVIFLPPDSLFVPNVFTPNGDAHHEMLISYGNVQIVSAVVLNRWGEQLYKAPELKWDGGGSPVGTYFYTVVYYDCLHEEVRDTGWVQLLR